MSSHCLYSKSNTKLIVKKIIYTLLPVFVYNRVSWIGDVSVVVADVAPEGDVPGCGGRNTGSQFGGRRRRELRLRGRDVAPAPTSLEVSHAEMTVLPAGGGVLPAAQEFLKRVPEFRTEDRIDDGVEGGVKVTWCGELKKNVKFLLRGC